MLKGCFVSGESVGWSILKLSLVSILYVNGTEMDGCMSSTKFDLV